ncbi:MAG: type II toxin-antitoxin system VapC family toxin [Enterobacterales bacterium]|nr:type II toxin-antitoxin system VapC family toxin [Enterobacterales bacterium]
MKHLLLDTHAILWWLSDAPQLGELARKTIADPQNLVYVSAASIWEMSIKSAMGKLKVSDDLDSIIEEEGFIPLPISLYHGKQAGRLPKHHHDPFDRMLIAQAQAEGLQLVTKDKQIALYGIDLLRIK